jgi:hypothetical protein
MDLKPFTLLRLELAQAVIKKVEAKEPKALCELAALALADDRTLKLFHAGDTASMDVVLQEAYNMPAEEVAALLSGFIQASQRFTLVLSGLRPEEVNQLQAKRTKTLRDSLGLGSPDASPDPSADTQRP